MNLWNISTEADFIAYAVKNRSVHYSKNMYPYIVLQYKAPKDLKNHDIDFEIAMSHDILIDKTLHCPMLRIMHSENCVITTNNGERDKPMTVLTRKTLRPNRIVSFKVNMKYDGIGYIGFFGEGVKNIDYLSLLNHMTIQSKYLEKCTKLASLIVSPTSFINDFDISHIPNSIQFLKIDGDMYKADYANLEELVLKENLKTLYLVGYGYTGEIDTLTKMSNLKNIDIIAPNAKGYEKLKKDDFQNAIQFDVGSYYASIIKR